MAKRENPYEAAFAAYLRHYRIPYVATLESHRQHAQAAVGCSVGQSGSVKNLDYLVSPTSGCTWLVDVKGRHFPAGRQKQYWKNWTTREDLRGLENWERMFGSGSGGLLIFAYMILGDRSPLPLDELFFHNQQWYAFLAIRWFDYATAAKPISPKWGTVAMPAQRFRELAVSARQFFLTENKCNRTLMNAD